MENRKRKLHDCLPISDLHRVGQFRVANNTSPVIVRHAGTLQQKQ